MMSGVFANLNINKKSAEAEKMQSWAQNQNDDVHYWVCAPGVNAEKWQECYQQGILVLGWDYLGDYRKFHHRDEIAEEIKKHSNTKNPRNDTRAVWEFCNTMKVGDIVFAKKGRNKIIGRGIVTSDYIYDAARRSYNNVRKVEWLEGNWELNEVWSKAPLPTKTLTDITKYKDWSKRLDTLTKGQAMNFSKDTNNSDVNYWWLNANPKIWSFNNVAVGEEQNYTLYNDNGNKRRVFQYFMDAKPGDLIIGYESTPVKQIVALAKVSKEHDDQNFYFEKTEQLLSPIDYKDLSKIEELMDMEYMNSAQGSLFKLTKNEYNTLMDIIRESNPLDNQDNALEKYSKEDFLSDVYASSSDYDTLCMLLKNKKNIILQGAPGVGKTFTAKRLAYSIMGKKDNNRIKIVQFHQNYTYEDFVMGYKPNGADFKLMKGVFYEFCIKAANKPKQEHFFIIDEINRGNMSKIFGELLMLIEKDYRGTEHKITLASNNKRFYVPDNLYIIGMMNTADRSLAMIDYALRRRFSFYEIKPKFASEGFRRYQKAFNNTTFDNLIMQIEELNKDIMQDGSLGSGFCIGHSYFCNQAECSKTWLKSVVTYEIIPMIQEYWFDDNQKVQKWINRLESVLDD